MTTQSIPALPQSEAASLTQHRKPLPALTGIRFFAAIYVVVFHFGSSYAAQHHVPAFAARFLSNGWTAVTLFFFLSGFILSYTYTGQIEKSGGKKRFWEARFARIYPVYLLSLVLSWPFNATSPGKIIAALFMVQAWNPLHPEYGGVLNMPAWTLSAEAFFYLLFPFLLPLIEKWSNRTLQIVAGVTLVIITLGHTMTDQINLLSPRTFIPMPAFRFPEFFAGMVAGLLFLRSRRQKPNFLLLYGAIVATLAILFLAQKPWVSLLAIPFAVLIYELAVGNSWCADLLGSKVLVLLGGASYSIYLLQLPVRSWVHYAVTGSMDLFVRKGGIDAFLSPIVLLALSVPVFLFLEEPARKRLRSWFKKHTETKPAAA